MMDDTRSSDEMDDRPVTPTRVEGSHDGFAAVAIIIVAAALIVFLITRII